MSADVLAALDYVEALFDYLKARALTAHLLAVMTRVRELPCPTEPLEIYPQ